MVEVGTYTFKVYKGGITSSFLECDTFTNGYDEYNDDWNDTAQAGPDGSPIHGATGNACDDNDPTKNYCEDMSVLYYVHVIRDAGVPASCDPYTISVKNAVP